MFLIICFSSFYHYYITSHPQFTPACCLGLEYEIDCSFFVFHHIIHQKASILTNYHLVLELNSSKRLFHDLASPLCIQLDIHASRGDENKLVSIYRRTDEEKIEKMPT